MSNQNLKPIAAAVGTAFVASLATASIAVADATNPFQTAALDDGQELLLASGHEGEGKCGEGKCGEGDKGDKGEGSCGEGDDGEGSCGESDEGEGSCGEGDSGEGKCGA